MEFKNQSPSPLKTITELTTQYITNHTMFTASDITKILRRENPTTNIRQCDVRDELNRMFASDQLPGYTRNLIDVDGLEVFLYQPEGAN